jgi:hypothetical protein
VCGDAAVVVRGPLLAVLRACLVSLSVRLCQVLRQLGIQPEADTFYYRCILKLSLDPEVNWWKKLERETAVCRPRARRH